MLKLSAVSRETKGEKVRHEGFLPAVVYGGGQDNISLSLNPREFEKLFKEAGESSLIDLTIDNKPAGQVLVYDISYEPVKGRVEHVDFKRVLADEKIIATVSLIFVGEAPAVKELGGTFVHTIEHVDIECLPKDLMHDIKVDVTILKTFDDAIKVGDLKINDGVKILDLSPDLSVAKVMPALTEEQIKAMEEAGKQGDVSKVEGVADKVAPEDATAAAAAGNNKEKKEEKKDEKKK